MAQAPAVTRRVEGLALSRRSLAPDLARGFMLLVIAIVHAYTFRVIATGAAGYGLVPGNAADIAVTLFMTMFAEGRGYPMFAALFGYGLAWIYFRRTAEGQEWPWVRSLVRGRGRWMVLIGFLHTLFLFYGDIIAVYGLVAILFAGLLRASDRRLLAHGFSWMAIGSLLYSAVNTLDDRVAQKEVEPLLTSDPLFDMGMRILAWPFAAPMLVMISVFPFLIGVWAARRRLLEEPELHLALLRRIAGAGIPVAVLGGFAHGLVVAGLWDPGVFLESGAAWLQVLTGYAGGFGYAALIALVAVQIGDRRGPVVQALVATGQRSMTCYLLQSVGWLVLFMPYTLNLAARLYDWVAVLLGVGVWLATVVIADLMRRAGVRGPAERLLRWATYRDRQVPERKEPVLR